jgi:PAS domain S-box-containing protein
MSHAKLEASTLAAILGSAPAFIYLLDLDYNIVYMNRFQAPMTYETTIGRCVDFFFTPDVAEYAHTFYEKVIGTGEEQSLEYFADYPDGSRLWYSTWLAPWRDEAGAVCGIICITTDVTKQKMIEQELKKTQSELVEASRRAGMSEVITGVLHNVGNVLNSINVSAAVALENISSSHFELLGRTIKLIESQQENLGAFFGEDPRGRKIPSLLSRLGEQIHTAQESAKGSLRRLMEQVGIIRATVEAQQSMAKPREVLEESVPGDLIDRAVSMFRIDFDLKGVKLAVDADRSARVLIDKQATLQILVNLIRNAIEAVADNAGARQLEVKAHTRGDKVYFEVADNGCGIPQDNLVKIFQYGFTTKETGHGFGLHTSAISAQAMGGTLQATSDGPGSGARFCLTLPRHAVKYQSSR